MKCDLTPVLASYKRVLPSISSEGLSDCQTVNLPNCNIVETLLCEELDLSTIPQPPALNVLLINFKLKVGSVFLNNLKQSQTLE